VDASTSPLAVNLNNHLKTYTYDDFVKLARGDFVLARSLLLSRQQHSPRKATMISQIDISRNSANLDDVDALGFDEELAQLVEALPALEQAFEAYTQRTQLPRLELLLSLQHADGTTSSDCTVRAY
jgi:hypothetical protein